MNDDKITTGGTEYLSQEPIELSHSAINDWARCPSYYLYRRVFKISPVGEKEGARGFGKAVHLADELRSKGAASDQAIDAALASFTPDATDDLRTPYRLRLLLEEYFKYYSFDVQRYDWLGSEVWFSLPLTPTINYRGYIDKVLKEKASGTIWFKDIKTTSMPSSFVSEPNSQFSGYLIADKVLKPTLYPGAELKGLIVDVIAVQKTKPEARKDGKGWLAGKGPSDVFFRYPTYRTPAQLVEWEMETRVLAYMIQSCHEMGVWPRWDNCRKYNQECPYRPLCNRETKDRANIINSQMYQVIPERKTPCITS